MAAKRNQPATGRKTRTNAVARSSRASSGAATAIPKDRGESGRSVKGARGRGRRKDAAVRRLAAADRKLAKQLPLPAVDRIAKESEEVVALIVGGQQRTSALTGEALPSPQQLARVRKQNLLRSFKERHRLLADTLTVREVCDLLGVSRQTPHDRVHAGTLVAIRDNGQLRFPAWQFDSEGPDGVVEGLPEVLQAMRGPISPLSKIKWFLTPKALMGERTPLDALRQGDVENAVAEARTIGAS